MSAVPFLLVAICIGVPLALVGWHVYEQWQIGRETDADDESGDGTQAF